MKSISEIDKNFKIETKLDIKGIEFYDIQNEPFKIYGVKKLDGAYRRMPKEIAKNVSEAVFSLHSHNAGGRVRFKTDSPYVAINAIYAGISKMGHFAISGSVGLDLYVTDDNGKDVYKKSFMPPFDITDSFESVIYLGDKKLRQITINMPTYSCLRDLYVGLDENSTIDYADEYKIKKPIVYYGSSITQGGCVSRPGNIYQARISRKFDADYIDLGFSGSARGEDNMADYIKQLDMSAFVYDYDHNAPTIEHLEETHERFFKIIREANPELPIIIMTAPIYCPDEIWKSRKEVIRKTYNNAIANGDKNVYFIDGKDLMQYAENDGTVDDCHPTDFGFYSMAETLGKVLEKIF